MPRIGYDFETFYQEKSKHKKPDGIHCVIPGCCNFLKPRQKKYCYDKCYWLWHTGLDIRNWEQTRAAVIKRDGKCMDCGITEDKIEYDGSSERIGFEVHHLVRIADGGDEFDMDNCITLCVDCHIERHRKRYHKDNKSILEF